MRVFLPTGTTASGAETVATTDGVIPRGLRAGMPVRLTHTDGARAFAEACRAMGHDPWVTVTSPAEVSALAGVDVGLWLRGHEAVESREGFTSLVLLRAAAGRRFVIEGLGSRAMAAAVAVGAEGVVLDDIVEGSTADETVRRVRENVTQHLALIPGHHPLRTGVDPLGTGVPIVQGPMANVAEKADLARAVSAAGGLPFAALGALRPEDAAAVLRDMDTVGGPWGVGIIGFEVMPFRDAHLALLSEHEPAAVIVAGGTPQLAVRLQNEGLKPWLHTPSPRLAKMALDRGVHAIVFEGHEAGGHVGRYSSIQLWEDGLAAVEKHDSDPLVVLAGGIGDPISAAFAAAMATPARARGAAIALQAGTAFFFTHEILEAGQITPAYQRAALAAHDTVLVGATVNLPLRCTPNTFTDEARRLEAGWKTDGLPLAERRERMEHHNLGRTRVAAKGIERDPDWDGSDPANRYRPVPRHHQPSQGAFTMGQGAAIHDRISTVQGVVDDLSRNAAALLEGIAASKRPSPWGEAQPVDAIPTQESAPTTGPVSLDRAPLQQRRALAPGPRHPNPNDARDTSGSSVTGGVAVAIVGMGTIVPGANNLPEYWRNLVDGVDAIGDIPSERWEPDTYYREGDVEPGSSFTYSKAAGAVRDFEFDPLAFRIPPRVAPTLDPSQRLALTASAEAVKVAGWQVGDIDGSRAAVVMGNAMGGEFAKGLALRIRFREVIDALEAEGALDGLSAADRAELEDRVEQRISGQLPPIEIDTMAGLLSNVIAGRVASWLDWMGGNMTVDAACAASLAATAVAVDWLRSGRCDVVLTGGVDTDLSPETYVGFCRTSALSSAGSRPFNSAADGFVMGEGCAVLALKRLDDAIRDGDPVWAVIRGVGQSSDGRGRGITAPLPQGQRLALERAYADAGVDPATVGMVEAHGTGTALGDVTETAVLADWFGEREGHAWLGSVKSMIGHLKGAAGAAGLVKATLAVATGVVPPTLNAGPVNPKLELERTPLRLPRHPARFPGGGPRRAGVSAFGFGGTNFHVVLEQAPPEAARPPQLDGLCAYAEPRVSDNPAWPLHDRPEVLCFGADTVEALVQTVASGARQTRAEAASKPHRLALLAQADEASAVHAKVAAWLAGAAKGRSHASLGTVAHYGTGPGAPIVLLAPGQGSQRPGATASLRRFAVAADVLDRAEAALGHPLDRLEARGAETAALHPLLFTVSSAWAAVAHAAGLPVAGALGHSLGEYAALVASGRLDLEAGLPLVLARGEALSQCASGAMLAVRLSEAEARVLAEQSGLSVAAVNDPGSTVLSGSAERISALVDELRLRGISGTRLDVAHAFHSPDVEPAERPLRAALADAAFSAGTAPCWSARSAALFDDPATDLLAALTEPVRFAEAIDATPADVLFVELGPGRVLTSRVTRCRPDAVAVALDPSPGDGGRGPLAAAAALFALGHPGLLELVEPAQIEDEQPSAGSRQPSAVSDQRAAGVAGRSGESGARGQGPGASGGVGRESVGEAMRERARQVQDLRIAALADAKHESAYQAARQALLDDLARVDAGTPPARTTSSTPPTTPAPGPGSQTPEPPAALDSLVAPERPAAASSLVASSTHEAVVAAIVEVTGYPADFLEDEADLEAELGVDSIRKMEILGLLQERLDFTTEESDYAELAGVSITGLVEHIEARLGSGQLATEPAPEPSADDAYLHTWAWRRIDIDEADAPALRPGFQQHGDRLVYVGTGEDAVASVNAWLRRSREGGLPGQLVVVGTDLAAQAAAGFARSLARETGKTFRHVQTSDLDLAHDAAWWGGGARVVRVDATGFHERIAVPARPEAADFGEEPFVVATGGASGIVARCLRELAPLAPRVLLFGRRPEAEVASHLEALRVAGVRVRYAACDITRPADLRAAIDAARSDWGPVRMVVHGAGVLRDGLVRKLDASDVSAVFGPKLHGAMHLIDATRSDNPSLWVSFGSIVASRGNPGQTLYDAANTALESLVHPTAERSLCLEWTAWSGVGMAADPALQRVMARRGIVAVDPDTGARAFVAALGTAGVLTITGQAHGEALPWPLGAATELAVDRSSFRIPLDPSEAVLDHHRVGGRPLVPGALWAVAMRSAVAVHSGVSQGWCLEGFAISAPTFVERFRDDVRVEVTRSTDGHRLVVRARGTVVAEAHARWVEHEAAAQPPTELDGTTARPLYRSDALFHGPAWQMLDAVRHDGNGGMSADLVTPEGADPVASAIDGTHQLLSAWSGARTGWLGLPVGAARWTFGAPPAAGPLRLEATAEPNDDGVEAQITVRDQDGRLVLRGEDVQLRRASRWPTDAPNPLSLDDA